MRQRRNATIAFLPVLALALSVGCSSLDGLRPVSSREPDEVEELQSRVLELQRKAAVTEVELERLRRRLAELEDGSRTATGSGPDLSANDPDPRVDRVATEVAAPRQVEPPPSTDSAQQPLVSSDFASSELPPVEPRGETMVPADEERAVAEEPTILASSVPGGASRPEAQQSPNLGPLSEAAQDLYDQGYTLFHQGRYLDAETTFRRFAQSYPSTELTDNASYWIGEARFARGDHEGALAAFLETAESFPSGNKVADSLFKAGQCLEVLDDLGSARQSYEEVVRRFPQTAAATSALERLGALR